MSSSVSYRFGFNGKENDNEVKGNGNQQNYGFRIYDPRLGKFLSVDPLLKEFPWNSTYAFAENTPIAFIDLEGAERFYTADGKFIGVMGKSVQIRNVGENDIQKVTVYIAMYGLTKDPTMQSALSDLAKDKSELQIFKTWKAWDESLPGDTDPANTGGELGGEYGFHHGGKQLLLNTVITVGTFGLGAELLAVKSIWAYATWEVGTKVIAARGDLTKVDWFDAILGVASRKIGVNVNSQVVRTSIAALKEAITSMVDLKIEDDGFRIAFVNKDKSAVFMDITFSSFKLFVGEIGRTAGAEPLNVEQMKMLFDQVKTQINTEIKAKKQEEAKSN